VSAAQDRQPPRGRWAVIAFVAVVLLAAVVVTRTCGQEDVRIDEDQAVVAAREAIDFEPERTSVRFVRQGVRSQPYYAISFQRGREGEDGYRLTTVLVDARSGDVADVTREA
jgi:hypothetical protein